ncbi:MAG: hypothetical protein ACR2PT_08605 [Endozoicomonas sp.]
MLLLKILVSVAAVVLLSVVAERVSTRAAGVLSGFPLGTGITLFFIGLEQGTEFVAQGAFHTSIGFAATLMLAWSWYQMTIRFEKMQVLLAVLVSIGMFFLTAAVLRQIPANAVTALLVPVCAIFLAIRKMGAIENAVVEGSVKAGWPVLLIRAFLAAMVVVTITGLANLVGPEWSGLLSAFPVTVFPLLLIIHITYGPRQLNTIIKNYPYGLGSLVLYACSVHWTYPLLGVYLGTVVSLSLAVIYILIYYQLSYRCQ